MSLDDDYQGYKKIWNLDEDIEDEDLIIEEEFE
jgi:hypothetical protein